MLLDGLNDEVALVNFPKVIGFRFLSRNFPFAVAESYEPNKINGPRKFRDEV